MTKIKKSYGTWPSPISAKTIAGGISLSDVGVSTDGKTYVWSEGRSDGSFLYTQTEGEGAPRVISGDIPVRPKVGYGGGAFAMHNSQVAFFGGKRNRLYTVDLKSGAPKPITQAFGGGAAPQFSHDGKYLAYVHHNDDSQDNIAVVDAMGERWPQVLATGHDFYVQPRFSNCGKYFAYIAWDHPQMPWDGSVLYLCDVVYSENSLPYLANERVVAGNNDCAVFQPEFSHDDGQLFYVSDQSGFGEIYTYNIKSGKPRQITSSNKEHGMPNWVQEMKTYCVGKESGELICSVSHMGVNSLCRIDVKTGASRVFDSLAQYHSAIQPTCNPAGQSLIFIGSSPQLSTRVVALNLQNETPQVLARSTGEMLTEENLAGAAPIEWGKGKDRAYGLYYEPTNVAFESDGKPPLMVLVHGGPTAQSRAAWDYKVQFFTSRGFAVLQVNHRGSTGYGREFMTQLRGNWGKFDVEDCVSGMEFLVKQKKVDPKRTAIMGGSAGGYTVLQTMATMPEAFAVGISMYGIADQFALARATHKFEERYQDSLIGTLPEAADLYRERSPLTHAKNIKRPMGIFQGEKDAVVPKDQAEIIVKALRRNGTPFVYKVYEGEGHGWRKAETIESFYNSVDDFLKQYLIYI